jgi:hypothetical protein
MHFDDLGRFRDIPSDKGDRTRDADWLHPDR